MLTKEDIEKYFIAEKQESLLFLIVGIIAVLIGIGLIILYKTNFWRGFALPLIIIGAIQITVGYTVFTRSDNDRVRVVYALDMNPTELQKNELPRMQVVNKNFVWYRWTEIILIITSVLLLVRCYKNRLTEDSWQGNNFWYRLAIALLIQSTFMLCADYFAEKRGRVYETKLVQQLADLNKR